MKCTSEEWNDCRVEKMGCKGCYYTDKERGGIKIFQLNDIVVFRENHNEVENLQCAVSYPYEVKSKED